MEGENRVEMQGGYRKVEDSKEPQEFQYSAQYHGQLNAALREATKNNPNYDGPLNALSPEVVKLSSNKDKVRVLQAALFLINPNHTLLEGVDRGEVQAQVDKITGAAIAPTPTNAKWSTLGKILLCIAAVGIISLGVASIVLLPAQKDLAVDLGMACLGLIGATLMGVGAKYGRSACVKPQLDHPITSALNSFGHFATQPAAARHPRDIAEEKQAEQDRINAEEDRRRAEERARQDAINRPALDAQKAAEERRKREFEKYEENTKWRLDLERRGLMNMSGRREEPNADGTQSGFGKR